MKEPIIILGMHRSGTTLLAKLLEENGVFMGHKKDQNNESYFFIRMNENWLAASGSNWLYPSVVRKGSLHVVEYFRYLKDYIGLSRCFSLFLGMRWGWKDPRNTFTIPAWLQIFPKATLVAIVRNGIPVAESLIVRNDKLSKIGPTHYVQALSEFNNAFQLWETYNSQLIQLKQELGEQLLIVRYEDLVARDNAVINDIETHLSVVFSNPSIELIAKPKPINEAYFSEIIVASSHCMRYFGYL